MATKTMAVKSDKQSKASLKQGSYSSGEIRRRQIIYAALDLFAKRGLSSVSLREINEASGTKNSGAIHYHFGGKEGLVEAMVEMIIDVTNEELSAEERDSVMAQDWVANLSELQHVLLDALLPTLLLPKRFDWGHSAICFLARLMMDPDPKSQALLEQYSEKDTESLMAYMRAFVPDVSEEILNLRISFMMVSLIHGLADVAYLKVSSPADYDRYERGDLIPHLIDYITGGITAADSTAG